MLQRRGHRQEGAIEDHAQHAVPIGQSHLAERLFRPAGGIVDQDVEAPKARDGGGDQALDGGLIADIGQDRQRLATERGDLASNGIDRALIAPAIDPTAAPAAASTKAMARPILRPAPVTSATRPRNSPSTVMRNL
jgi:hypothetical protein